MTQLREDITFAMRSLRRVPSFVATVLSVLALGIGTTAAVFSVATTVLIRDLPIRDQNDVIAMWAKAPGVATEVPTMLTRYDRYRAATRTLSGIAGVAHFGANMVPVQDGSMALHARESLVTGNFFDVLGVRPVVGRLIRPEDDVVGATPAIVISEAYWRSTFDADPGVVGRHLRILNREMTATVVGVVPAGVDYPNGTEYWFPIVLAKYPAIDLVARLRPGETPEHARIEFAAFIENDTRAFPSDQSARALLANGGEVHRLPEIIVGPARQALIVLGLAVSGLLLIACVNISNLLLVRTTGRTHELAVRRALGADSRRIAAQLTTEVAMLWVAGASLGAGLASLLLHVLVATAPPGVPRLDEITLSPIATVLAAAAALVCVIVAGVLPAVFSGTGLGVVLRSGNRVGAESRRKRRVRSIMVGAQIALALVLLTAAGLLTKSLIRLQGVSLGYTPTHLSIVQITAPYHKYTSTQQFNDAFDAARLQLRSVPGVSAVTPVLAWPFLGSNVFAAQMQVRDRPDLDAANAPYVSWDAVGSEFSQALDAPIIRGRGVGDDDRLDALRVALVTEDLARLYWPGQNPLGKQLRFAGASNDSAWRTVVGVTRPLNYRTMREATPTVLFSYRQEFQQGIFAVRASRALPGMLPELRRAASASDRDIVLWRAQTMDQVLSGPLSRPRLETFLLLLFGISALGLAAVGLYGVTASLLRQQTREFGVRIALGASPRVILRLALADSVRVALLGVVVGIAVCAVGRRLLAAELFQVSPSDPVALLGAGASLVVVAAIAAYMPARRAARIDPIQALKAE